MYSGKPLMSCPSKEGPRVSTKGPFYWHETARRKCRKEKWIASTVNSPPNSKWVHPALVNSDSELDSLSGSAATRSPADSSLNPSYKLNPFCTTFAMDIPSASSYGNAHSNSHRNGHGNAHGNHLEVVISIRHKCQHGTFSVVSWKYSNSTLFWKFLG